MAVMSKKLQISKLKMLVSSNKRDLFDWQSEIDAKLSYSENKTIILRKLKTRGLIGSKTINNKKVAARLNLKAQEINNKRKKISIAADGSRKAKKTFKAKTLNKKQFLKWKKNKGKYDIEGIDSLGTHFKKTQLTKAKAKKIIKDLDIFDDLF